jgi:hypothetical protein
MSQKITSVKALGVCEFIDYFNNFAFFFEANYYDPFSVQILYTNHKQYLSVLALIHALGQKATDGNERKQTNSKATAGTF